MIKLTQLFFFLDLGGVERKIVDLVNNLPDEYYQKQIILSHGTGMMAEQLSSSNEVITLPEKHKLVQLIGMLGDREICHVHTTNENPFFLWAANLANVPVIINAIEGSIVSPWSHFSDIEVCESEAVRRHQPRPVRTEIIANGVKIPVSMPMHSTFQKNRRIILTEVRRPDKQLLLSLETSLEKIKSAIPESEGWIIGSDGSDHDGLLYFGKITHVGTFLHHADFLLNLSTHEASSNAVLEAMAHGVIPIVSTIGGNREIVRDGVTGFCIEEQTEEKILGRIIEILEAFRKEPEEFEKIRRRAYHFVCENFSRESMVNQYKRLYHRMLHSPAPRITKPLAPLLDNAATLEIFLDTLELYCFQPDAGIEAMEALSGQELSQPQLAFTQSILAREKLKSGDLQAAHGHITRALEIWPDQFYTALTAGYIFKLIGDIENAAQYFKAAYTADSDHIEAAFGYLECLLAMEQFEEAEQIAQHALKQLPADHALHSSITVLLRHLERQLR